ncbi:hypothetical protein SAMN04489718_0459 [Actinopolyspora saharensis]|uniref:Uncharacterized protein n=1 Tax=Actinopolyspora saharensis TaxID=995062 RepID=A0A1H0YHH3_9ACTN|nr:hypothetical protein SAMN04489718_0459 [Actinopolyspora saharensis]
MAEQVGCDAVQRLQRLLEHLAVQDPGATWTVQSLVGKL